VPQGSFDSDPRPGRRLEVSCESCGATLLVEPLQRTARCPYCDSPSVVDRPATPDRPDPEFALGFTIDREEARRRVRRWISRRRMGPFGLARAPTERIEAVYLPVYLYSASAHAAYSASIAEKYGKDGEKKTEYRPLEGRYSAYVADVVVTASRGIANDELQAVEPFDLRELRRYSPALVSGWLSEEPSVSREECRALAREESMARVTEALRSFLPGDGSVDLDHHTELRHESVDLTLVPVWVFAIRYDPAKPPIRVLVNGQTGKAWGRVPTSWKKVALLAAAALALYLLVALLSRWLG